MHSVHRNIAPPTGEEYQKKVLSIPDTQVRKVTQPFFEGEKVHKGGPSVTPKKMVPLSPCQIPPPELYLDSEEKTPEPLLKQVGQTPLQQAVDKANSPNLTKRIYLHIRLKKWQVTNPNPGKIFDKRNGKLVCLYENPAKHAYLILLHRLIGLECFFSMPHLVKTLGTPSREWGEEEGIRIKIKVHLPKGGMFPADLKVTFNGDHHILFKEPGTSEKKLRAFHAQLHPWNEEIAIPLASKLPTIFQDAYHHFYIGANGNVHWDIGKDPETKVTLECLPPHMLIR